jgi:alpha-tubulin suppressor-like RCC1 family protein
VAGRCVTEDEWVQLSAAKDSSCALKADGSVWCWGVLDIFTGAGCSTDHAQPVQVSELPPIQKLALGTDHACALSRDGEVWCWGSNVEAQLATTTPTPTCKPVRALDESDTPLSGVSDIFSGEKHSCALYADHRFACWGNNSQGELGDGSTAFSRAHLVLGEDGEARWASSLCLGIDHACAIGEDNRVECWGKATDGRLSDGNIVNALSLSCGKEFTCALVADPSLRVRCWGKATELQLGHGSNKASPIGVGPELSCTPKLLTTGEAHACVVCDDGQVLCWGKNNRKQSCSSADQDVAEPCVIRSEEGPLSLPDAVGVAGGNEFSCVGTPTELFCWGRNNVLQLGDSHSTDCSRAQPVCSSSSCPPPC